MPTSGSKEHDVGTFLYNTNCLEWKTRYDKFNFLYLYIRHLFPEETISIVDSRQMPIKYLKKFNKKNFKFPLQFCNLKKNFK